MGPNFEIAEKVEKMEINKGKERERKISECQNKGYKTKEHIVYRKIVSKREK